MSPALEPPFGPRDPHGMAALVEALPRHIEEALARGDGHPWALPVRDPDLLAVGGMGGSAIAGELTAAIVAAEAPRPLLVVRGYRWPACVTAHSLALLSSNSGNTEETLALDDAARAAGVPRVAMASGGELAARAARDGLHLERVPSGMPPRAALFHGWVPVTRLVHALGWCSDPAPAWREAAARLAAANARLAPGCPEADNPAKRLARDLHGRTVLVYSSSGAPAAVATRWRQQLNENAKMPGHSAAVPELHHNEIVSWQDSGPVQRGTSVVMLRDAEEAPEERTRLDLTVEIVTRQGGRVHELVAEGESRIARMAQLVQFGDWVSLYLALLAGADPTDIRVLVEIKQRLAAAPARRARG